MPYYEGSGNRNDFFSPSQDRRPESKQLNSRPQPAPRGFFPLFISGRERPHPFPVMAINDLSHVASIPNSRMPSANLGLLQDVGKIINCSLHSIKFRKERTALKK